MHRRQEIRGGVTDTTSRNPQVYESDNGPRYHKELNMPSMHEFNTPLESGVRVQVRNRFDGGWTSGFQIFASRPSGNYLVRRLSDGAVLPFAFTRAEVRLDPVPLPAVGRSPWSPPAVA